MNSVENKALALIPKIKDVHPALRRNALIEEVKQSDCDPELAKKIWGWSGVSPLWLEMVNSLELVSNSRQRRECGET